MYLQAQNGTGNTSDRSVAYVHGNGLMGLGENPGLKAGVTPIYVSVEGAKQGKFKGESTSKAHEGQMPAVRFLYEVKLPVESASGRATARRQHSPILVTKEWGPASPQLFQALVTNEILPSVVIQVFRPQNGVETLFQTFKLTNALVVSMRQRIGPEDSRPLEDVAFTFQKIEFENRPGKTTAVDSWTLAP